MAFKGWDKVTINNDRGEPVGAIAPLIISASRATDIPAFFMPWFMRRLERGYIRWVNPFNRHSLYISMQNVKLIVFWTKNAAPLLPYVNLLQSSGREILVHFTVNNYPAIERAVPPLEQRLATFRELSSILGNHCVMWRFDPVFLTSEIDTSFISKEPRS